MLFSYQSIILKLFLFSITARAQSKQLIEIPVVLQLSNSKWPQSYMEDACATSFLIVQNFVNNIESILPYNVLKFNFLPVSNETGIATAREIIRKQSPIAVLPRGNCNRDLNRFAQSNQVVTFGRDCGDDIEATFALDDENKVKYQSLMKFIGSMKWRKIGILSYSEHLEQMHLLSQVFQENKATIDAHYVTGNRQTKSISEMVESIIEKNLKIIVFTHFDNVVDFFEMFCQMHNRNIHGSQYLFIHIYENSIFFNEKMIGAFPYLNLTVQCNIGMMMEMLEISLFIGGKGEPNEEATSMNYDLDQFQHYYQQIVPSSKNPCSISDDWSDGSDKVYNRRRNVIGREYSTLQMESTCRWWGYESYDFEERLRCHDMAMAIVLSLDRTEQIVQRDFQIRLDHFRAGSFENKTQIKTTLEEVVKSLKFRGLSQQGWIEMENGRLKGEGPNYISQWRWGRLKVISKITQMNNSNYQINTLHHSYWHTSKENPPNDGTVVEQFRKIFPMKKLVIWMIVLLLLTCFQLYILIIFKSTKKYSKRRYINTTSTIIVILCCLSINFILTFHFMAMTFTEGSLFCSIIIWLVAVPTTLFAITLLIRTMTIKQLANVYEFAFHGIYSHRRRKEQVQLALKETRRFFQEKYRKTSIFLHVFGLIFILIIAGIFIFVELGLKPDSGDFLRSSEVMYEAERSIYYVNVYDTSCFSTKHHVPFKALCIFLWITSLVNFAYSLRFRKKPLPAVFRTELTITRNSIAILFFSSIPFTIGLTNLWQNQQLQAPEIGVEMVEELLPFTAVVVSFLVTVVISYPLVSATKVKNFLRI